MVPHKGGILDLLYPLYFYHANMVYLKSHFALLSGASFGTGLGVFAHPQTTLSMTYIFNGPKVLLASLD